MSRLVRLLVHKDLPMEDHVAVCGVPGNGMDE